MAEENKEKSVSESDLGQKNQLKKTLVNSPEGRCLLAGVALALIFILWLGAKLLLAPEDSQAIIGMTATQIMFGRAAGLAFGYSMGLKNSTVIPVCIVISTILVLIFYPLFVFSWRHLLVIKQLKNIFERVRKTAEAHKDIVIRYGIAGLFLFVWFPFWMTGPLVGCVIGFMMGLRTWLNMTVVLSGTYVATLGWAVFLRQFHSHISSYSLYAMLIFLILLLVIIIVGHLLHRTLHENKNKEQLGVK
ncbi:MAG: small multi-drug export protein [Planctomycetes bacterium]|nr:small multi-drug export protein [Planctomycetota bacterium]MBU1517500.1 small multi-drug export protein [Planctomycetota bacterium]MBU2457012.1 small multi-drug export protein [Planctomycetota bacterium]